MVGKRCVKIKTRDKQQVQEIHQVRQQGRGRDKEDKKKEKKV